MTNKKAFAATAVIVLVILSFCAVFLLSERYSSGHGEINLPSKDQTGDIGIGTLPPSHLNDPSEYSALSATAEGVLGLISSLSRPAYFTAEFACLLGSSISSLQYSAVAEYVAADGLCRITLSDRYYVMAEGVILTVSADGERYSDPAADFDLWAISGIPDPTVPPETQASKISAYGFAEENGTDTVYVEFSRDGYRCKQSYSLDSGLLVMTEIYDGNVLIYKCAMQNISYEQPDLQRFSVGA